MMTNKDLEVFFFFPFVKFGVFDYVSYSDENLLLDFPSTPLKFAFFDEILHHLVHVICKPICHFVIVPFGLELHPRSIIHCEPHCRSVEMLQASKS